MSEMKRIYRQSLPAMKFVGRCYGEEEKQNGTFSHKWGEWFCENLFAPLAINDDGAEPFEDCNAFYGLSRCKEGEPFEYWIGVFLPPDATVPDGTGVLILTWERLLYVGYTVRSRISISTAALKALSRKVLDGLRIKAA